MPTTGDQAWGVCVHVYQLQVAVGSLTVFHEVVHYAVADQTAAQAAPAILFSRTSAIMLQSDIC